MRNSMSAVGRELSGGEAAKRARNRVALHFKFLHPPTQRLNLRTCSGQLGTEVAFLADFRFERVLRLGVLPQVGGDLVLQRADVGQGIGEFGALASELLFRRS